MLAACVIEHDEAGGGLSAFNSSVPDPGTSWL